MARCTSPIHAYPIAPEQSVAKPILTNKMPGGKGPWKSSRASSNVAPRTAGTDSRNEKVTACRGGIPSIKAREIVMPDLEMPGITPAPWAVPIAIAREGVSG